jgi:YgiT-type zinc finger domain-containing protein
MNAPRKHRCGGTLLANRVQVRSTEDGLTFEYYVPGFVCNRCGEELIDRNVAATIETTLPLTWFESDIASSRTRSIVLRNVPSSTPSVAAA